MIYQILVVYPLEQTFSFVEEFNTDDMYTVLEQVFEMFNGSYGKEHPVWSKSKTRSMSPGDFVVINDTSFQCLPFGWKIVDEKFINNFVAHCKWLVDNKHTCAVTEAGGPFLFGAIKETLKKTNEQKHKA